MVHKNQQVISEFVIVLFQAPTILGLSLCQHLNLVKRVDALHTADRPISQLLAQFQDLFNGVGCLSTEHHIAIDPSISPVIHPCRRVLLSLLLKLKLKLAEMEKMGVIKRRNKPTDWVSSMLYVEKKILR